jgi:hypothetical protein
MRYLHAREEQHDENNASSFAVLNEENPRNPFSAITFQ